MTFLAYNVSKVNIIDKIIRAEMEDSNLISKLLS